jgi:hypothetical protein
MCVAGSSGPASELGSEPRNLHTDHIVLQESGDMHPHFPPFIIYFYTYSLHASDARDAYCRRLSCYPRMQLHHRENVPRVMTHMQTKY